MLLQKFHLFSYYTEWKRVYFFLRTQKMETRRKRIKNASGSVGRQVRVSTVNFQNFYVGILGMDSFILIRWNTWQRQPTWFLSFILTKILILCILHKVLQFIFLINISPGIKEKEKLEETLVNTSRYFTWRSMYIYFGYLKERFWTFCEF